MKGASCLLVRLGATFRRLAWACLGLILFRVLKYFVYVTVRIIHLPNVHVRTFSALNSYQMLKTQDLGYVSTRRSADERRAAKLRESLHMLDAGPRNKHTVFFDSEKEAKQ